VVADVVVVGTEHYEAELGNRRHNVNVCDQAGIIFIRRGEVIRDEVSSFIVVLSDRARSRIIYFVLRD
jgi:hypothetical protein